MKQYFTHALEYIKNILNNCKDVFRNHYADFQGTATRSQFWGFILCIFVCFIILRSIASILALLLFLGAITPCIAITVRRIRNAGIDYRVGFLISLLYIFGMLNMLSAKVLMLVVNLFNFVALIALVILCVLPSKKQ